MRIYLKFFKLSLVLILGSFFLIGSGPNFDSIETTENNTTDKIPLETVALVGSLNADEENYFITKWKTDNQGTSNDNQIIILTSQLQSYQYDIEWGDGTVNRDVNYSIIHTYENSGIYSVKIVGRFPHILSMDGAFDDALKLISIEQWGTIKWESMYGAFSGCSNMIGNFTDIPDLSHVKYMNSMFYYAKSFFNQDLSTWDVSKVEKHNNFSENWGEGNIEPNWNE